MSGDEQNTNQHKKTVQNVIYSVMVFLGLTLIGASVLAPNSINGGKAGAGTFLAVGLSLILTIIFSMWFSKRQNKR